jgi:hypothetical protein
MYEVIVRWPGYDGSYALGPFPTREEARLVVRWLRTFTFPPGRYGIGRLVEVNAGAPKSALGRLNRR